MSRRPRVLAALVACLSAGVLTALVLTATAGTAFAMLPAPDPALGPVGSSVAVHATQVTAGSGLSMWSAVVLVAIAVAVGVAVTEAFHRFRHHGPMTHRATV